MATKWRPSPVLLAIILSLSVAPVVAHFPLNWVDTAWTMMIAACLTLGVVHLYVWHKQPSEYGSLLFFALAVSISSVGVFELSMMRADTPEAYATALRLAHLPIAVAILASVGFVRLYLGAGRDWLAYVVSGLRLVVLALNFATGVNINFERITGLDHVRLWGGPVVSVPLGILNPWWTVAQIDSLLLVAFIVDASITLWSRGGPDSRRRALAVGGGLALCVVFTMSLSGLVFSGQVRAPTDVTPAFFIVVVAMGYELGYDVLRAAQLAGDLRESERRWRTLLEKIQLLVLQIDVSGRVVYANPHFARVSGNTVEEIFGLPVVTVLRRKEPSNAGALQPPFAGANESDLAADLVTRSGAIRHVEWSTWPLHDESGERIGLLGVGADVTEMRQAELARDFADKELRALKRRLEEENLYLKEELTTEQGFGEFVVSSDCMKYVMMKIRQVAPTEASVLILGETGVGKELVARAVHAASSRASRPFVKLNCAALASTLVESELFGHERGAFTGASSQRKGRFELADGSTLFLDEVCELPIETQAKLLRVLQEGEFERVGGTRTLKVDVRIIAATNRDLSQTVAAGDFREDLYYRLNVYPITVPPLRKRIEDIPALVRHFAARSAKRLNKPIDQVPAEVMHALAQYEWPGNVRELENVVERAIITSSDRVLRLSEPLGITSGVDTTASESNDGAEGFATLESVERQYILQVLEKSHWRISGSIGAARILGLHPSTLRSRMRKLGLSKVPPTMPGV